MDLMIDIETLGQKPGCVIVSLGAVAFDPRTGEIGPTLMCDIDLNDSVARGLRIEPGTVLWWLGQSREAQDATFNPAAKRYLLAESMSYLTHFWEKNECVNVWSHGATFDVPILERAYSHVRQSPPWQYRNIRDTRTVIDLAGGARIPRPSTSLVHHALDDAWFQAHVIMDCYKLLGVSNGSEDKS